MKKTFLVGFLFFFLFLSSVLAVPPFIDPLVQEGTSFLNIVYPVQEVYGLSDTIDLNWFVTNSSAFRLNASDGEVSCYFGLQNESGNVLFSNDACTTSDFYFSHPIVVNKTGFYSYVIWCNSSLSDEYGFVEGFYYVTAEGKNYPPGSDSMSGIVIILGVFAVCGLLLYISFKLDGDTHKYLQLIILGFVVGVSILIPKTIMDYANNFGTSLTFFVGVTWFIRVFWVYMFFYLLYEFFIPFVKGKRLKRKNE